MESFVYEKLNLACKEKDERKVETLGPYASVLRYIVKNTEFFGRKSDPKALVPCKQTTLYRGLQLE